MSAQSKNYYIYILASKPYGVLYVGVTNDIYRRILEHKTNHHEGFTKKYLTHRLVYYEGYGEISMAIQREKRLKKWSRQWKLELINKANPSWKDLYYDLYQWLKDPPLKAGDDTQG